MAIMVWGHRGHRHYRYPQKYTKPPFENSLLAYAEALQVVMGVECDLIQSRDETVYLTHGTSYDEKGKPHNLKDDLDPQSQSIIGDRFVYQLSDEVVRHLKLMDSQDLPTLAALLECLKYYPGRYVNLELKGPIELDAVLAVVEQAVTHKQLPMDRIVFSSFYFGLLADLRGKYGDSVKIGCLFDTATLPKAKMYPDWPEAPQDAYYIPFHLEDKVMEQNIIKAIKPDFFNLERGSVTSEALAEIAQAYPRAKVIVWTDGEGHPDEDDRLMETIKKYAKSQMIYAAITDFPDVIQVRLAEAGVKTVSP